MMNPEEIKKIEEQYNIRHCLNAITFQSGFIKAMAYTFGHFFICNDSLTARKLSEEKNIDCITLDGDIYRSQGMVTGGSAPNI